MAVPIDITNQRFGKLIVIDLVPEEKRKNSYKRREWYCKCDCGTELIIEQRNLTGKAYIQQSCDCIRKKAHLVTTSKFNLELDTNTSSELFLESIINKGGKDYE